MKRTIYLFCAVCLTWGCTNDPTNDPDYGATSAPGKLVPVSLKLHVSDYSAPTAQLARSIQTSGVSSDGTISVEISASTPSATRAGDDPLANEIPDDDKIFGVDILQFNGTEENAQLILKQHMDQPDGNLSLVDLKDLQLTESPTVPNRIVVVCNADLTSFYNQLTTATLQNGSYEGGSTYGDYQNMRRSRASQTDQVFPRVSRELSPNDMIYIPIITGTSTSTIASGTQVGIELLRTIAKANFEFKLSQKMQDKYTHWDILLNNIPTTCFYNPQGRSEPFPSEPSYYNVVLGTNVESASTSLLKTIYLPVNLQASAPGTTVANRYLNAPAYATSLQLLGKKIVDGNATQTVVFQIPLGNNFTDNFSIYANSEIHYGITLADDSPTDSSVVKFIPGKFGGKITGYDANGETPIAFIPGQNPKVYKDAGIDRFEYSNQIEIWSSDVTYKLFGGETQHPDPGVPMMPWGFMSTTDTFTTDLGDDWLWDGRGNTQKVCGNSANWYQPYAAYSCYRQLNSIPAPYNKVEENPNMWYLPAINELLGVYIAAGSQISAMQSSYWSSSLKKDGNGIKWAYRLRKNGTTELLNVTEGATMAAVRGCRLPPPPSK